MSSILELENQCKDDYPQHSYRLIDRRGIMLSANIRYYKKQTNIDVSTLLIGESIIGRNPDSAIFVSNQ